MNGNSRKKINDVIVPQNDMIRRPSMTPEAVPTSHSDRGSRIEKNPFFEKTRPKRAETTKVKKNNSRALSWALLFVLFLGGGFAVASYFSTAIIEVMPITRSAKLDNNIIAAKESVADEIAFEFITTTATETKEIPVTVEKKIQKKASGTVAIYNAYSSASQKLIKNTRLETPDHKIYRIDESIIVPGAEVSNGKVVTPGKVEAIVYADVVGEEYNIGLAPDKFTIPGFKGDPRFSSFYAVSKPDSPIGGGFSGAVTVPSDEAVTQAREDLKQNLKKTVVEKARTDIPENMTFFPGSIIIKFEEVPQDFSGDNASKVSMRATASVFFFDTEQLTEQLISLTLPEDSDKVFAITNMSDIVFTFLDPVDNVVLSDLSEIRFNLSGQVAFAGVIDTDNIKQQVLGKNKKDLSSMIIDQSNIYKANVIIRPVWKTTFPLDVSKVTVKILENN